MAQGWYPGRRDGQLHMVKTWNTVFTVKGPAWGIPQTEIDALKDLTVKAEGALDKAKSGDRSPVITAECNEAFTALREKMRYIKRRWLMAPPLTSVDFASLLLDMPDETPTPIPTPTGFAEADVSYPGTGVLELHIRPVEGQPWLDSRGDWLYHVYYGIMPPGGATVEAAVGIYRELMKVPQTGDELPLSFWTRRRKERLDLHVHSSKTVYFCIRYEDLKRNVGPWGPLFSAVVP